MISRSGASEARGRTVWAWSSRDSTGSLEARLLAGRFTLWCTLADHRARGMRATLTVR